jgi:hypothetical protein
MFSGIESIKLFAVLSSSVIQKRGAPKACFRHDLLLEENDLKATKRFASATLKAAKRFLNTLSSFIVDFVFVATEGRFMMANIGTPEGLIDVFHVPRTHS